MKKRLDFRRQPRKRTIPTLEQVGLTKAEAGLLRRALANVLNNLSDKQLELRADALLTYLVQRSQLLEISAEEITGLKANARSLREFSARLSKSTLGPTPLDARIKALGQSIGLDHIECAILAVMARRILYSSWRELIDLMPIKAQNPTATVLSALTGIPLIQVDRTLAPGKSLFRANLLRDDRDGEFAATDLLARIARSSAKDAEELFAWLAPPAKCSTLQWEDFDHIGASRDLALQILVHRLPVSILLYGAPGTGKTEFARLLADQARRTAVFAGLADDDGKEPTRSERLGHLAFLKALLVHDESKLIVVDEADDVLDMGTRRNGSKQWINGVLEAPLVPTIWILNDAEALGPSSIRRMALAIRFDRPPASVRRRIVQASAKRAGLALTCSEVGELAATPATPAVIATGLAVAAGTTGCVQHARLSIQSVMAAMGEKRLAPKMASTCYDPCLSTAEIDLDDLASRLRRSGELGWNMLLSGPSGTGKTAYARYLAERLDLDVEECHGADLLGPYIGETEAKIAAAFTRAETRGALLLIDEADSFLFRRSSGQRSWETGLVNEMLRQMEGRLYPFVATTNLADQLDPATQRRFCLRIKFDVLTGRQIRALFASTFAAAWPDDVAICGSLTPGDFAVVAKRARLMGNADPSQLVQWLSHEAACRSGGSDGRMGFQIPPPHPVDAAREKGKNCLGVRP